ncbi:EAL domain-containing protein [Aurantiacibacter aquimixticola]|uniref:EAL domain-containing protein n=1 Tax=Aurantiacibacter aquimixticola TaxID=1958945 RepID=A0A419RS52_9SPHN|nr:EAL domain-containing protein [Aurantiacibacter aquimixticola]RJY08633.1 EAL domain-containing protein [Aurantiacibacter aquimixticola]
MSLPVHPIERRERTDRRRSEPHPVTEDLADALTANAIELLFQPQWRSSDGALVGAEALVRWEHPDHGTLAGDALVAIAQSGGIARRLSRHIARAALNAAAQWPDHLRLALNVTAMDLFDRTFGEELLAMLADTGFPASRLTLEITEQALVADLDRSAAKLEALAGEDIRIALDDFGAGFCNFRYLKVLPLDALKLDKSMLDGVTEGERDLAVLRAIVAMARALDLTVIAEGVESAEQRDIVTREGCDVWQGYLGARPEPAADFASRF